MQPTAKTDNAQPFNQVTAQAQQLAAVVCNTLGTLWAAGQQPAAKAPIQFLPDVSQFGTMAQSHGVTIYTITSTDPVLALQFPSFMFFLLPTAQASIILEIVNKIRRQFLTELSKG